MKTISVVGIDLAKTIFQLHGNDANGKTRLTKKLRRTELSSFVANLPKCTIAMEACGSANFWATKFKEFGHEVKLIAPQYVKPFVKNNKNDAADAEAIAEAAVRPNMRFVPLKNAKQLDLQMMHRIRQRLVRNRTALCNEMRSLLYERGIIFNQGIPAIKKVIPEFLKKEDEYLKYFKIILGELYTEFLEIEDKIASIEKRLESVANDDPTCKRLLTIRGVGLITATAIVASTPDPNYFKNGRQYAAWLGLVPKHTGSGGKNKLMGISKRGDRYLRSLLVHGGRSVIRTCSGKEDRLSVWLMKLKEKAGHNKTCVALANKNARIILAMMKSETDYNPKLACKSA